MFRWRYGDIISSYIEDSYLDLVLSIFEWESEAWIPLPEDEVLPRLVNWQDIRIKLDTFNGLDCRDPDVVNGVCKACGWEKSEVAIINYTRAHRIRGYRKNGLPYRGDLILVCHMFGWRKGDLIAARNFTYSWTWRKWVRINEELELPVVTAWKQYEVEFPSTTLTKKGILVGGNQRICYAANMQHGVCKNCGYKTDKI